MKEFVKCLMAALVAIIAVTANAAWTFDPTGGTLDDGKTGFNYVGTVTDGVVTFHVTDVTENENNQLTMTINAQYGYFNDPAFQGGGSFRLISPRFTTPKERGITQLALGIFLTTQVAILTPMRID